MPTHLKIFSLITIVFWLSFLAYLPPFIPEPNVKGLISEVEESKEMMKLVPESNKPPDVIEAEFHHQLKIAHMKCAVIIALGAVSGLLMLFRKRSGQILAIALCALTLCYFVFSVVASITGPHGWDSIMRLFTIFFPQHPLMVIHNEIIGTIFKIATLVYLTRKSVSRHFSKVISRVESET